MPYGECKVYFDGSHYIAIPHTKRPAMPKRIKHEEVITLPAVTENEGASDKIEENDLQENSVTGTDPITPFPLENVEENKEVSDLCENNVTDKQTTQSKIRKVTRKELFEELYAKTTTMRKAERKAYILNEMKPHFKDENSAELYVAAQFERKHRNMICRRVRLNRKINLAEFNYFCTFTYANEKHTEQSFKKKLQGCFKMMCHRKGWKYVGVWERSPEKQRLHFHGLFSIPKSGMVGELIEVKDYSVVSRKVQATVQNTYFNERFGRSDFKAIENRNMIGEAVAYLTKYIEKTGEKIVYSKGLPQYFVSDIMDEDVVCRIGLEDKKLLLYDDFNCWDEGVLIGKVSKETIAKMPKEN